MENENKFIELLDNLGDLISEKFKEKVKDEKLKNLIKKQRNYQTKYLNLLI